MNILMPQLGETVAEGKITKWFKSAGDAVQPGDNLFEIETDKVSMEVPATEAGILNEIRVLEGEVAPVGAIVGVIGDGTGAVVSAPAKSGPAAAAAPKAPAAAAALLASAPPAPLPMTPTMAPTGATSPSGTRISLKMPASIAGTSIETLSVSISNRLSPGFTASPADLNHLVIFPSATVSPSCGMRMFMMIFLSC